MKILVEPQSYSAASAVFDKDIHDGLCRAVFTLSGELGECRAMAGSDTIGAGWADQYDSVARSVMATIGDACTASLQLAAMLERTGFNHGVAESASDPSRREPSPADTTRYVVEPPAPCMLQIPSARGGSTSPPHGWGLLQHAIGYLWPDGDPHLLRSASAAWSAMAERLDTQSGLVGQALVSILEQQSAEVEDAWSVCNSMGTHLSDVADVCRTLATACSDLAGHIDNAHAQVRHEVESFVEWTAGIEVAGGVLAFVTAGMSEAAAQVAEAAKIIEVGGRIAALLKSLGAAAETVTATVRTVASSIAAVAERLKLIIGARLTSVTVAMAARGPEFAGEAGAYGRLTKAAESGTELARVDAAATGGKGAVENTKLAAKLDSAQVWPRGNLPVENGPAGGCLVKRNAAGDVTNYGVYDEDGMLIKRVDLRGRGHGDLGLPHTHMFQRNSAPDGRVFNQQSHVRASTASERLTP